MTFDVELTEDCWSHILRFATDMRDWTRIRGVCRASRSSMPRAVEFGTGEVVLVQDMHIRSYEGFAEEQHVYIIINETAFIDLFFVSSFQSLHLHSMSFRSCGRMVNVCFRDALFFHPSEDVVFSHAGSLTNFGRENRNVRKALVLERLSTFLSSDVG